MPTNYHDPRNVGEHRICPTTQKLYRVSWTDHSREGVFNSCANCNDKQFNLRGELTRLNETRKLSQKEQPK